MCHGLVMVGWYVLSERCGMWCVMVVCVVCDGKGM